MEDRARPIPASTARRPGELPFALGFLLFSAFLLSQIGNQAQFVPRTQFAAQPAFWPLLSILGMTGFAALWTVALLRLERPGPEWREMLIWLRAFEFVGWYLAYAWVVQIIGYLPGTMLVMPVLVWRLGLRGRGYMAAALGFAVAVVVLFKTLLSVRIPGGAAYDLLPPALRSVMVSYF